MKLERRVLIFSCGINPMNGLHICIYKHVNTSVFKVNNVVTSAVKFNLLEFVIRFENKVL